MYISFETVSKTFNVDMKGSMTHTAALGSDGGGNITRINNAFDRIPQRLASVEAQLETLYKQQENARAELGKPFERERELAEKSARLAELDSMLNMDEKPDIVVMSGDEEEPDVDDEDIAAKSAPMSAKEKPSLLATLEKNAEKSRAMFGGGSEKSKSEHSL